MAGFEEIRKWMRENPYQAVGLISGFVFSVLIVFAGFWKTLFIFCITALGFFLGKQKDESGTGVIAKIKDRLGFGRKE